jgi:hypothetical protein
MVGENFFEYWEYSYNVSFVGYLLDNMTSVGKGRGDISISHHFAPESSYNVPSTPSKTSARAQTRMYDIKAVTRYYGINHPILSPSKKQIIEEKLTLD